MLKKAVAVCIVTPWLLVQLGRQKFAKIVAAAVEADRIRVEDAVIMEAEMIIADVASRRSQDQHPSQE